MSFYSTPLGDLCFEHLKDLLDDKAQETTRLEFKRETPDRDETLKKISSFANTIGGRIIVGMEADKESRAIALPGVDRDNAYESRLTSWCAQYLYPMLVPGVSPAIEIPSSPKVAYVIEVHESDVAPHFIEGRRGCYIRVNESSHRFEARLAESDELQLLFNRREESRRRSLELEARSRNRILRRAGYLKSSADSTAKLVPFTVRIAPVYSRLALLPVGDLCTAIQNSAFAVGGGSFPDSRHGPCSQTDSILFERALWGDRNTFLEVTTFGSSTYVEFFTPQQPTANIDLDREDPFVKGRPWISMTDVLRATLVGVKFGVRYLKTLRALGRITLTLSIQDLQGLALYSVPHGDSRFFGVLGPAASPYDEQAEASVECSGERLGSEWSTLSRDLWRELYFSCGWSRAYVPESHRIVDYDLEWALKSMSETESFLK